MSNRAKCKLCEDIIQSKHAHDYVTCKCGEISVYGGQDYFRARFNNHGNFLIIDDEGNEIIPKEESTTPSLQTQEIPNYKPNKTEMLDMLDEMSNQIERLPREAMLAPITHSDFGSLIMLLSSILRSA